MTTRVAITILRQHADTLRRDYTEDTIGVALETLLDLHDDQRNALQLAAAVFDATGGQIKAPLAYKAVTEALEK